MYTRNDTLPVKIGDLTIGAGNPIRIQSMTNVPTRDVKAVVSQIAALEAAGCEIVRCTVPDEASAAVRDKKTDTHPAGRGYPL